MIIRVYVGNVLILVLVEHTLGDHKEIAKNDGHTS